MSIVKILSIAMFHREICNAINAMPVGALPVIDICLYIQLGPKVTVTPDRTISGSYAWFRFGQGVTDRQCLLRSPVAIAFRDCSLACGMSSFDLSYAWSRDHQRL